MTGFYVRVAGALALIVLGLALFVCRARQVDRQADQKQHDQQQLEQAGALTPTAVSAEELSEQLRAAQDREKGLAEDVARLERLVGKLTPTRSTSVQGSAVQTDGAPTLTCPDPAPDAAELPAVLTCPNPLVRCAFDLRDLETDAGATVAVGTIYTGWKWPQDTTWRATTEKMTRANTTVRYVPPKAEDPPRRARNVLRAVWGSRQTRGIDYDRRIAGPIWAGVQARETACGASAALSLGVAW